MEITINMNTRIYKFALMAIGVLLLGGLLAAPAQAGTTDSGSSIVSESASASADNAVVTARGAISAKVNAKTLARVKANGTPKSVVKKAKKLKLKKADSYYTSYTSVLTGKEVWHWKRYPKGKTFVYTGGWYRDPNCHNKVAIKGKKKPKNATVIRGKVKFVKSVTYTASASAKVTVTAIAKAKAWCKNEWTSASAEASATASGAAYARVSAKGSTKGRAEASAKGAAKKLALSTSFQSSLKARVAAAAKASATANATAKVKCGSGPTPPPTTPPPPVVPKPLLIEITTVNDVLVNNSRTLNVSGNTAPGHSGTLFCTARNGGTITAGKTQSVSGSFTKSITYRAPSEVPAANGSIAAGRDRVDCTLTQDDGQSAAISTNQFEIRAIPPESE